MLGLQLVVADEALRGRIMAFARQRLGPALEPYRKGVFLACKTTQRTARGAEEELQNSLEMMRTDHFDLYQMHWPDPDTPVNGPPYDVVVREVLTDAFGMPGLVRVELTALSSPSAGRRWMLWLLVPFVNSLSGR